MSTAQVRNAWSYT